jgi:Mg-chelatase subunit ChlD/sugar lactone lactonase YvrE
VAVGPDGRIYVADAAQGRIHELSADGDPLRLLGDGQLGGPTDVALADDGTVYVADPAGDRVLALAADGTVATSWRVSGRPTGLAVAGDALVVVSAEPPVVTVLGRADGVERRRWGGPDNPFKSPRGVALSPDGHVHVADVGAKLVWAFDADGVLLGALETWDEGTLLAPLDVAADANGELYVATELRTYRFQAGQQVGARFESPGARGLATGPGPALVVSAQDDRLGFTGLRYWPDRRLAVVGAPTTWGNPFAPLGTLEHPRRLSANTDDHVFLIDDWSRVQDFGADGRPRQQFTTAALGDLAAGQRGSVYTLDGRAVTYWTADGQALWSWRPASTRPVTGPAWGWLTAVDADGDRFAVLDIGDQRAHVLDYSAGPVASWPLAGPETFAAIGDLALAEDRLYLLNRADRRVEVRDLATGAIQARWTFPGAPLRLDAGADGRLYVLTREGWVFKRDADGSDVALWEVGADGEASDLAVGADGRVYVSFEDPSSVGVWAPDPGATPPAMPEFPDRCELEHDKTASPATVELGEPVGISLTVEGTCPLADAQADVLLLVDTSGSMLGSKMAAARSAALNFVGQLDYGLNQIGLVTFSSEAVLVQPLTNDPRALIRIIPSLGDEGATSMFGAMLVADKEFDSPRARPGVRQVIVLLTDGQPTDGYGEIITLADAFRQAGREVYTIGLGLDVARGFLRQLATRPSYYFEAPSPYDLNRVYDTIARRVAATQLLAQATVTDVLPANMRYQRGSAVPPASFDTATHTLTWTVSNVPPDGLLLRYRVVPQEVGRWPTNVRAQADVVDGAGHAGQLVFPVPEVEVRRAERWTAYLPILLNRQCPDLHADVVLAFDTSSSMQSPAPGGGTKLDAALYAGRVFINQLKLPADRVALIAFHSEAVVVQPLTGSVAQAVQALDRLPTGNGTRLDRGLDAARGVLAERGANRIPVTVLLTDGRQSGGTEDQAIDAAEATRRAGIVVYTVGLGADADRVLLERLAGSPTRAFHAPTEADLARIYREIANAIPCQ